LRAKLKVFDGAAAQQVFVQTVPFVTAHAASVFGYQPNISVEAVFKSRSVHYGK
jgi:hypothetical protein